MDHAAALCRDGTSLIDAIVAGIARIEDDPEELSVGFGGLPNELGVVELDAAVMHGPLHKAGAVAGLRGVRHAAAVALEVLRRTDHALLVGDGALAFARVCGFKEEDLLTDKARKAWLDWKASLSPKDAWLTEREGRTGEAEPHSTQSPDPFAAGWAGHKDNPTPGAPPPNTSNVAAKVPFTYGTVHVSARDAAGDLFACTSTSGLSYKIAGRAGDTPIIGAGIYCENGVGSAGATGRGEASMHACAAFEVVRSMERGMDPTQACLAALRLIDRTTRQPRLRKDGKPAFNVTLYALRADGDLGSASIHPGYTFVAHQDAKTSLRDAACLFAP